MVCRLAWRRRLLASTAILVLAAGGAKAQEAEELPTITVQAPTQQTPPPSAGGEPAASGGEVQVQQETAWGPVDGYVATRSATATKSDTPLIDTPQSISVITADQMEAQNAETIAQALRYTPGLAGEKFGLDARGYGLQLRGFRDTADAIFYRDGMALKGSGYASFLPLDPYGAERLEVLRGPASVLYGEGDPGGIINYVSKRPTTEPKREVEFGIGSHEHYEAKFDFSGPLDEAGVWSYRLTGRAVDSETQVDFVDADRIFIAPALTWRPNADTSLTLLGNYQKDETGWLEQFLPAQGTVLPNPHGKIPPDRFIGEPKFDKYDLTQYSAGYLFEHRVNEHWTLRQNLRYAHLYNEQQGVFGSGLHADLRTYDRAAGDGVSSLDAFTVDNQAQVNFDTGVLRHTLLAGLDYQNFAYDDRSRGFTADDLTIDIFDPVYGVEFTPGKVTENVGQEQQQLGLYLQDQIKLGNWNFQLGGRYDDTETKTADRLTGTVTRRKEDAVTGRAGVLYHFDNGVAPYFSYAQAFLPLLGTDVNGQPFEPETAEQYEVGVKYQPHGLNALLTFAAFDLTKQNVPTTDPEDPLFQIQTGEIRSRGVELELTASVASGLDLKGAYTYLDTEIMKDTNNQGNVPYGIPTHMAALWADYTFQHGRLEGFGFGAGVRYIGETYGDDANTFKVPDVTLADAAVHYDWGQYRFAVNATNVFDKDYVGCFAAASGCNYGQGRTILASVRRSW